ncbi:hypothetical protein [Holospora undulata]|uniref:Transposase IS4-like domain-containing protein n=1 Tax=Holospora undulata HU1 TaxID=1321371 RepID=A0A061JH11_9PROT|nr:hypothetical protein [Holospora undulata]ETZ05456.1 hypothetical protein K737_300101 [Holospora undulata HU1]
MSTLSFAQDKDRVIKAYKQRWDIERLFRTMKTQGVNLENPPMKDLGRLSKLDHCRCCYCIRFYNGPYTRMCLQKNSQSTFLFIFVFILHKGAQVDQR